MIAVLSWRASGPSQYILYEIGLCLSARKPIIVFVDDHLPDNILPPRILQRRFSYRTYFRQFREHTASLRTLKTYLGDPPPTRYQPNFGRRMCGLTGFSDLSKDIRDAVTAFVENRFYKVVDLDAVKIDNPLVFDTVEFISNLDITIICIDSKNLISCFWSGAIMAAAIPFISLTNNVFFQYSEAFPKEFQSKNIQQCDGIDTLLEAEFDLFEQNFLSVDNSDAIERYTKMQVEAGALAGNYESGTRRQFAEVILGDQYNISGQAGAVGPSAHAHDMTFNQAWSKLGSSVDLDRLADELMRLREAAEERASDPDQKLATGAIAAAEQSASQKNGPKALEYLRLAGKWALDLAQQIGVEVAKGAISSALGVG